MGEIMKNQAAGGQFDFPTQKKPFGWYFCLILPFSIESARFWNEFFVPWVVGYGFDVGHLAFGHGLGCRA
jgi:hypothetical protein